MPAKPKTFDDCLAAVSADKRAVLEKLRKLVKGVAPDAEEYVGYGLAAFRLDGVPLVAIGAGANHSAVYMMNGSTIESHKDELKDYDTSKGAVRFPADEPLPVALVRKLVKIRVAENAGLAVKAGKDDWREETLARVRALILEADPEMIEERKWRKPSNAMAGVPVWSHNGIVCTGETYTKVVKLTFARGAGIPDPSRLFNSSLEGNTRRAIDIHEGTRIDATAFKALVKAAVAQNGPPAKKAKSGASDAKPVKLLSGGNPQIAKADGDAPVQAYIAAMPGWKHDIGRWLDALIVRTVPHVRKAVRWNTPFYGVEGQGWFLGFHCITKYVKVAFFRGASLSPLPPGESKQKEVRYLDIYEDDQLDEKLVAGWIRQASKLPGELLF